MSGTLYGLGVGPGDPELVTLKAVRLLRSLPVVAYPAPEEGTSFARSVVASHLSPARTEIAIRVPMTRSLAPAQAAYDRAAIEIAKHLEADRDVGVLCQGDPFFYGSFMHLYARLHGRAEIEVIAGIPGMAGCWNVAGLPIALGDDVMTVLTGTLPEAELERRVQNADALVIMKTGRNLAKIRRVLEAAGRLDEAWLIERGTMPDERVARLADVDATDCPYFAIVLVHGRLGRRREAAE
jgi:precorrin-2/cobalt-factor-2 C20-methyltransferase